MTYTKRPQNYIEHYKVIRYKHFIYVVLATPKPKIQSAYLCSQQFSSYRSF